MRDGAQPSLDAFVDAAGALCDHPNEDTLERFIAILEENDRHVCLISSHRFTQVFTETSPGNWVNAADPEGDCGIVRLDRFQIDRTYKGSMTMWNYTLAEARHQPGGRQPDIVVLHARRESLRCIIRFE